MTRFMLVRHGVCAQTDSVLLGRTLDAPLDQRGRDQVAKLASHFDRGAELALEASPRRRTQQTAAAIAAQVGVPVRTAAALDEVDFGRWAGASFKDLERDPEWRSWNERRGTSRTPAGDSMADVQRRVIDHLQLLNARHPARTFVLVTHAEVIRAALMHALHASLDDYWRYGIEPATCTTLRLEDAGFTVEAVNASAPTLASVSIPPSSALRDDSVPRTAGERCGGGAR